MMQKIRVSLWLLTLCGLALPLRAQSAPAPPFAADSRLGELYQLGRTMSTADKTFVDVSEHLLVSVDSARLALRFPAREKLIVAGENQQLLILTGTVKNPQKRSFELYGGSMMTVRFFGTVPAARPLYAQETTVQADSLTSLRRTLQPGESARYALVLRVPSDQPSLTVATLRPYGPLRRYDLGPVSTSAPSVFARTGADIAHQARAATGAPFDLDSFDMEVTSVREVPKIGSYLAGSGKFVYAAEVQVTNRMLLPESWGWQYCTPELKDASGGVVTWSRDMLDARTGQTFSRDLAAGESATVAYVFTSATRVAPAALSLTMLKSKRRVEIALR